MAEPEFIETPLADLPTQQFKLKKEIQAFWDGERAIQKFLILDLQTWKENAVDDVHNLIDYHKPSFVQQSYGLGWVDVAEKGCRVVAAIVAAASPDWSQSRFRKSVEINQSLAQQRIGTFEYDKRVSWSAFRDQVRSDLTKLVGAIISGGYGEQPLAVQSPPAAPDPAAFSKLGFTKPDIEAVEQINAHLMELLKDLNRSRGEANNDSVSE
jgi:hypothetical protein